MVWDTASRINLPASTAEALTPLTRCWAKAYLREEAETTCDARLLKSSSFSFSMEFATVANFLLLLPYSDVLSYRSNLYTVLDGTRQTIRPKVADVIIMFAAKHLHRHFARRI